MNRHSNRLRRVAMSAGLALGVGGTVVAAVPASAAETPVRVTTAASDVRDAEGRTWYASGGFTGGTRSSTTASISRTSNDVLYRHERYGMSAFARSVPNGTYSVTLKMAEIYWQDDDRRVFSVYAEGRQVVDDLDLFDTVGRYAAHDRTFTVDVTDGRLDLRFSADANFATVSALSFVRVASTTTTATAPAVVTSTTRPSASNTGVPAGTTLRQHRGNLTITTPGATYDRLDIHGFVNVKAPNVKITRSIIRGGRATHSIGLVTNTTATATGLVIEDSEIVPEHPSVWLDGVKGANFTLRRVDVRGTVDNVKVHGDNVVIENSWLHDSRYYSRDPHHRDGSHNDGVQVLGGRNIRIRNNTITGARNAALQVTQDFSATTDVQFTGNYADGGGCTVNLAHDDRSSMSGITVRDNRFGRNTRYDNCAIVATRKTSLTASNNVWDDTGAAVRIRDGG